MDRFNWLDVEDIKKEFSGHENKLIGIRLTVLNTFPTDVYF